MKRKLLQYITVLLLLLRIPVSAAAASQTGSLVIQEIEQPVCLYRVTGVDGAFTADFSGCSLSLPFSDPIQAARQLQTYAVSNKLTGQTAVPEQGEAVFAPLEEGMYLVCSLCEKGEFAPFLLSIPTSLNGKNIYHIQAKPKLDDTPTETDPTHPTQTPPSDSDIPQTGTSVIPRYALMILGTVVTLVGLYEVIRGREEHTND